MITYLFVLSLYAPAQQVDSSGSQNANPQTQTAPSPVLTPAVESLMSSGPSELEIRRSQEILQDEDRLQVLEEIPAPVQKVDLKRIQEKVLAEEDQE